MPRVLVIDNFDSFTYMLVDYLKQLGAETMVYLNNKPWCKETIETLNITHCLISPGPHHPKKSGISLNAINDLQGRVPLLGVCLGHQALAWHDGARITTAPSIEHGKSSSIYHQQQGLFSGLPSPIRVTRYHSLAIDPNTLPSCWQVTARSNDGVIMAIKHQRFNAQGVQFHPESIATEYGLAMLQQFLAHDSAIDW